MKDVPGENVRMIVSYLKGAILLLASCNFLPTGTSRLLNDTFCLSECSEFTDFMKAIYFQHKRKLQTVDPVELLTVAEVEYRTLYRNGKCTAAKNDPGSPFYVEVKEEDCNGVNDKTMYYRCQHTRGGREGGRNGGQGGRTGCGRGGSPNVNCHNCGKWGHFQRERWSPGG